MSYHIYTTQGIILKRNPTGESDLYLHVLTQDFGIILASAKSVRTSTSKLRQGLLEYNLVTLSCIKGKRGWKVTNVVKEDSFYYDMPQNKHRVVSQVADVLIKMMPGESEHGNIFEIVKTGFVALRSMKDEYMKNFEMLIVLKILNELGYIDKNSKNQNLINNESNWDEQTLLEVGINKKDILDSINKAFKESHL